jgi:hypothetical protein
MSSVLNTMAKKIRICARSKKWWNADIKERRRTVGREKKRRRHLEEAAREKAELQKLIGQYKRTLWGDYLQNLMGAEVLTAARYANARAGTAVVALTDRDNKQANTWLEKEEMLRYKSFPPNDGDQYYELPPAGSAHTRVTEQAVERASFSQSVKKAQEPDKLSFAGKWLLWALDKERIVRLTRAAIRTGRHSAVWKLARGLVIRKPGKDNYTMLKAYHFKSLLRCMGKVVEKVATELLSEKADWWWLLSDGQFGSRKGRSAIDAAAIMVNRAHAAWTNGHIRGVLLMDINAAFPSGAKGRLLNWIKVRQMDGDLVQWKESFLSERMVEMILEGNAMGRHPGEAEVPQGSPVSPILFAIYTSGLIKWVEDYESEAEELSIVDNLASVVTETHVNHVVSILEKCAGNSIPCVLTRGLQFNTENSVVNRPVRPTSLRTGRDGGLPSVLSQDGTAPSFWGRTGTDGKDGRRRRSLSAHNKNYTKIISITILTVMQDLWASAPSILVLTRFLQRLCPLHPGFQTFRSLYNNIGLDLVSPKDKQ